MSQKNPSTFELFRLSEQRLDDARKVFEAARATVVAVRRFGCCAQDIAVTKAALVEAAAVYADYMRTHTALILAIAEQPEESWP